MVLLDISVAHWFIYTRRVFAQSVWSCRVKDPSASLQRAGDSQLKSEQKFFLYDFPKLENVYIFVPKTNSS